MDGRHGVAELARRLGRYPWAGVAALAMTAGLLALPLVLRFYAWWWRLTFREFFTCS